MPPTPHPLRALGQPYLQIPDLDLRVHRPCPKNEPVWVELSTGESCRDTGKQRGAEEALPWDSPSTNSPQTSSPMLREATAPWAEKYHSARSQEPPRVGTLSLTTARALVCHLGEDTAGLDVRESPVLEGRNRVLSTQRQHGGSARSEPAPGLTWSSEELSR